MKAMLELLGGYQGVIDMRVRQVLGGEKRMREEVEALRKRVREQDEEMAGMEKRIEELVKMIERMTER